MGGFKVASSDVEKTEIKVKKSKLKDEIEQKEKEKKKAKKSKEFSGEKVKKSKEKKEKAHKKVMKEKADDSTADFEGAAKRKRRSDIEVVDPPAKKSKVDEDPGALSNFRLSPEVCRALEARGITKLFAIQQQTFDYGRDGVDVIARAKTGSGKTLAFSLPMIERILAENKTMPKKQASYGRAPRAMVMCPTRELALQVSREIESVSPTISCCTVYGGTPYGAQCAALRRGLDIIIGTPGRISDHLEKGNLKLDSLQYVILDEADEMLAVGFREAIEKILESVPPADKRQTLLFSATLPEWVHGVAKKHMRSNRVIVDLVGDKKMKANADVSHYCMPCHWESKPAIISDTIRVYGGNGRTIVFTPTKKEANELVMNPNMTIECQALHGDIAQSQREITLKGFREGKFKCLVATDVAARGIDITGVELVVQSEPPTDHETYIHRAGRTGRAGNKGRSILLYTPKQVYWMQNVERRSGIKFEILGCPQPIDMIKSSVETAMSAIDKVPPSIMKRFMETAKTLIKEKGAEQAVAACLISAAGLRDGAMTARSLLTGLNEFVTVQIDSKSVIRSLTFLWNLMKRYLPSEACDNIRGMRLRKDGLGGVCDYPAKHASALEEMVIDDAGIRIFVPDTLPELDEKAAPESDNTRRYGKSNGGWNRRGGGGASGGNQWGNRSSGSGRGGRFNR